MQLQMTAPLDIGLDLQDATLHNGQDDIFDLDHAQRELRKKGGIDRLADETGSVESDSDDEQEAIEDDGAGLDSEEERERAVAGLEDELDGMYDAYQERMKDRDTKYRVKEARRKDKAREEWHGIQKKDSDDEDSEDGGWEEMEDAKANVDQDSESDEESDFEDESADTQQRKRVRTEDSTAPGRQSKKARLSKVVPPVDLQTSRASKVWFDQDIFSGMEPLVSDDEEEEEVPESDDLMEVEEEQDGADSMDQDYEVVPQDADMDDGMWDVEDENLDEIKQAKIKSEPS